MQDTVTAVGAPQLRDELADYVLQVAIPAGTSDPLYTALGKLTDRLTRDAIEQAASLALADVAERAFLLGWECGRDPAKLVFRP